MQLRRRDFLVAASAAVGAPLLAAQPENRVVLNLEPTRDNPRNSEGAFATLKSGRVIFLYTQFYGGSEDKSPARIVAIHSDDRGITWSAPRVVVENTGHENVMSVSLLRLASGRLALFYAFKNNLSDCRPRSVSLQRRSADLVGAEARDRCPRILRAQQRPRGPAPQRTAGGSSRLSSNERTECRKLRLV